MNSKNEISRMTIDLPVKYHKRLKILSVALDKSMKEMVIESIINYLEVEECQFNHTPNKITSKALKEASEGIDLIEYDNLEDFFKKMGV